jgi:putative phosphoesterase
LLIGIISDTHGYFEPRLPEVFRGVDQILHAGDIGSIEVIESLEKIAPVVAVHGNMDRLDVASQYPIDATIEVDGVKVYLVHRPQDARPGRDVRVVVEGHTHRARIDEKEGVLYVNPGPAGKTLTFQGRSVALLDIPAGETHPLHADGGRPNARIIELD